MIDKLYAKYSRLKDKPPRPGYKPENVIRARKLLNRNSDKLVVIFPGWHTHNFPVNILAKRLAKKGWAVLYYDFHDQIIEPEDRIVAESFRYLRDAIADELLMLQAKYKYSKVHFISISLGTVSMALVAEKFNQFDSATIVVGGDNLAIDMWHGLRTLYLRDEFKKDHISMRKLSLDWHEEAPKNHADKFKDKQVRIILSKSDKFILPNYQMSLAHSLESSGAITKIESRRSGHLISIIRYCLIDSPI